jgi:hemolysin activation/secretion protein
MLTRYTIKTATALIVILTFAYFPPALAQPPDAGRLLQEQRQIQPTLPDRFPEKEAIEVERPPLADTGVKVLVKGFRFSGGQGIVTDAELLALVQDAVGKELGFAELQRLAERITSYLREKKGYLLARGYLPRQDVTAGIIEIAIIAGRIEGKARIRVKEPRRIRQGLLEGIAGRAIPEDAPARLENIERAVLLMNDLPGIASQASLERGETPGATRVVIAATEDRLLSGLLSGDNYGDRYTGTWRGNGQAALNDPFGLGDQFSVSITGAEHMLQGRAAYSLPVGASGMVWSASYTDLSYELGAELADLKVKGDARTIGTNLSYPLLRSRNASIWSGLGFEYLLLRDEANGTTTRDRKLPVGNASLTGSFFDGFGGGGLTSLYLALYYGKIDLSGLAGAEEIDAASARSAGDFARGIYSLARLQRVTQRISLFGSLRGQFAGQNLDSSQKFILGGPSGVRAYPVGEASGDEGHLMTFETRLDAPGFPSWATTQLVGFIDAGYVHLHKDAWPGAVTSATGRNDYWLSGGGVGVNVGKAGVYGVRASYAYKINDNPGRSSSGKDVDNYSNDGRFWLQAMIWF